MVSSDGIVWLVVSVRDDSAMMKCRENANQSNRKSSGFSFVENLRPVLVSGCSGRSKSHRNYLQRVYIDLHDR